MTFELDMSEFDPAQARYITLLVDSGQKIKSLTVLFGKEYLWMEDPATKHLYLERLPARA